MKPIRILPSLALSGLLFSLVAADARAGDLDPPAGPVAPTMKTLDEVEARTPMSDVPGGATFEHLITEPGSYYLTGDIVVTLPISGIVVDADDVTIDLNGFTLVGQGGFTDGVRVINDRRNITIRNGSIRGFGSGVWAFNAGDVYAHGLRLHNMGGAGLFLYGKGSRIVDCHASDCGGVGLVVSESGLVRDSVSRNNNSTGIGIGAGSVIENSVAIDNGGIGVESFGPATANNVVAKGNGGVGISLGTGSTVLGCSATNNAQGGIRVVGGSIVRNCTAFNNGEFGISAVTDCLIEDNASTNNDRSGGGIGIHLVGVRNLVRANMVTFNGVGFKTDQSGNVLLGNVANSNTDNYGQAFGTIGPIIGHSDIATNCNPDANRSF